MTSRTMRNVLLGAAAAALMALGGCAAYPDGYGYGAGYYGYPVYGGYEADPGFAVSDWGGFGWGGYDGWHHGDWHHGDWHGGGWHGDSHAHAAWHVPAGGGHPGFGGAHGVAVAHAGGGGHSGGGHGGRG
jgi:hypothetical protein